jgi:hypothetical protein
VTDACAQEVDKMKRGFEEQMTKMRGEVSKIQEEKVHLMGLEQRLRQEFQTQVMVVVVVVMVMVVVISAAYLPLLHCFCSLLPLVMPSQVQAEQMSNEELRIRLETLQVAVARRVTLCVCDARGRTGSCSCAPFYEGKSSLGRTATGTPWRTCDAAPRAARCRSLAWQLKRYWRTVS